MMSPKRSVWWGLGLALCLVWLAAGRLLADDGPGGKLGGQPAAASAKVARPEPPPYTDEEVQAFLKEVLPLVEKVAGRRFKTPPRLKNASVADVAQALARDLGAPDPEPSA